jgi:multiple sugar transport system substrate-binding protein
MSRKRFCHSDGSGMGRRQVLKLLAAGGVGLAGVKGAAWGTRGAEAATGGFDWRKYAGQTIRVLVPKQPGTDFIEPLLPEFEKLSGVKVNWEKLGEDQQRQKLQVELTSGMADLDVFGSHTGQQGKAFMQAGWYEVLDPWVTDPQRTAPDYDFADWDRNVLGQLASVDGKLVGILIFAIAFSLYYRKDLFQAAGLGVPKTMEEMEEAAKKLTDKRNTQFGMLLRGQPAPAVGVWPAFLHNFGGTWLTPEGRPSMNAPQCVESIQYYGRLAREYGPPGVLNLNWPQLQDLFLQGKGAMFVDTSVLVGNFEDPKMSRVVGRVGYAPLPAGKGGQIPGLNGWMWAVYAKSKKKEVAWSFIQWATGKEMSARLQRYGIQQGRRSAWQDPEFQKGFGAKHPDLTETMRFAYAKGKAFLYPPYVNVALARDTIGEVIAIGIQGGDVKAAADKAQAKLEEQQKKERG